MAKQSRAKRKVANAKAAQKRAAARKKAMGNFANALNNATKKWASLVAQNIATSNPLFAAMKNMSNQPMQPGQPVFTSSMHSGVSSGSGLRGRSIYAMVYDEYEIGIQFIFLDKDGNWYEKDFFGNDKKMPKLVDVYESRLCPQLTAEQHFNMARKAHRIQVPGGQLPLFYSCPSMTNSRIQREEKITSNTLQRVILDTMADNEYTRNPTELQSIQVILTDQLIDPSIVDKLPDHFLYPTQRPTLLVRMGFCWDCCTLYYVYPVK